MRVIGNKLCSAYESCLQENILNVLKELRVCGRTLNKGLVCSLDVIHMLLKQC